LAQQNAQQVWQNNYWNEFQQVNKGQVLNDISNFLSIPIPNYIECLDISNLYKQDVVAGFLAFINGRSNLAKTNQTIANLEKQITEIKQTLQQFITD
jgi:excinuclease UvrABC nuclease subunit